MRSRFCATPRTAKRHSDPVVRSATAFGYLLHPHRKRLRKEGGPGFASYARSGSRLCTPDLRKVTLTPFFEKAL